MHHPLLLALGLLSALCLAATVATVRRKPRASSPLNARGLLTKREQPMYWRLRDTFPEYVVLAQVAFSALLTTRDRSARNRFDRKVADFVLCDRAMRVLAVIELDDSSHAGRAAKDSARAALLEQAGYMVLRFPRVPDAATLRALIAKPAVTQPPMAQSP